MKNKNFILLSALVGLSLIVSCNKLFPFRFSDNNNIVEFSIKENNRSSVLIRKEVVINPDSINYLGNSIGEITLFVDSGIQNFPLTICVDIKVSSDATINNWPDPNKYYLAFQNIYDNIKSFYVVSSSGIVKQWFVKLRDNTLSLDPTRKNANILSYAYSYLPLLPQHSDVTIDPSDISITQDSVYMVYTVNNPSHFLVYPITIIPTITLAPGATFIDYTAGDPIVFNAENELKEITVLSADGTNRKTWYIGFQQQVTGLGSGENKVIDFTMSNVSPNLTTVLNLKGIIDSTNHIVYIPAYVYPPTYDINSYPATIDVSMLISDKASITSGFDGKGFSFNSMGDKKQIMVTAENGKSQVWNIQLLQSPQIPNSGFEDWGTTNNYPVVNGGFWSANNFAPPVVSNRVRIVNPETSNPYVGSTSARISTKYIYTETRIIVTTVRAYTPVSGGMLFLGKFNFNNTEATLRNPLLNYTFGIPHPFSPTYVKVAFKYLPTSPVINANLLNVGNTAGQATPTWSPFLYADPVDSCNMLIRVLDASNNIIGSGRFATHHTYSDWKEIYIPVTYTGTTTPAQLDIRFSSSKKSVHDDIGLPIYVGGSGLTSANITNYPNNMLRNDVEGSVLHIDDVELMYTPTTITYPSLP